MRSIDMSVGCVVEVWRCNVESVMVDCIISVVVYFCFRCWKIGNVVVVLLIFGVVEENDIFDLVFDGGVDFGYGVGYDGSVLVIDGEWLVSWFYC